MTYWKTWISAYTVLTDTNSIQQRTSTTFMQLDTSTGKIDVVQWSLDDGKEGSVTLNNEDLSLDTGCGTFELYPTKNMYQFILLDKVTGRKWHVQWGFEASKRWIKRIY